MSRCGWQSGRELCRHYHHSKDQTATSPWPNPRQEMPRSFRLWWSRSRFWWKIRASVDWFFMIDIFMAVRAGKQHLWRSGFFFAISRLRKNVPFLLTYFYHQDCARCFKFYSFQFALRSSLSRAGCEISCAIVNQLASSCLVVNVICHREGGGKNQLPLFNWNSEVKTITCFKWHN